MPRPRSPFWKGIRNRHRRDVLVLPRQSPSASTNAMQRWSLIVLVAVTGLGKAIPAAAVSASAEATGGRSQWVYLEANGRLGYRTLTNGDRIMDFSSAGYMGGGVAIPFVPVKATVSPSGGDDTAAEQEGVNRVSEGELADGFRGAVLLKPGSYDCKGRDRKSVVERNSG